MAEPVFFSSDFFAGNRVRLRTLLASNALIVVTANGLMQRNADNTYTFRQDSNFWYLTGINKPDLVLVIDEAGDFLIIPERDPVLETFEGSLNSNELTEISGIPTVFEGKPGWDRLQTMVKRARQVATTDAPPAYLDFYQFYTNPARAALIAKLQSYNAKAEIVNIRDQLAAMRVVKQAPELAAIRRAVDVTVDGLLYIADSRRFASYQYEYEVEADLTRQFRLAGYGHCFDPIVANGVHGVKMHATENDGPMSAEGMTILDVGAEVSNYAADIARTVMAGQPTKRQQALYDAVCEAQDYAYSLIKPGVVHLDYEKENERFIGEKLRQLGVIKEADHEAIRRHFPHMMSHFVGLEPHDVGDYHQPMQVGTVMVVEPGMYLYDEGLGCRVEDVVVITEDGYEHLSRRLPRRLH